VAALVKNGFGNLIAQENSLKIPILEADSPQKWHDSIKFHEFDNQKSQTEGFFQKFRKPALQNPDTSLQ